jgi:hypothetical protein
VVVFRGGRSQREHKTRDAYCGSFSAPAPGASAWRSGIKAGVFAINDEYRERVKFVSSLEVDVESSQARLAELLEVYAQENSKVASA